MFPPDPNLGLPNIPTIKPDFADEFVRTWPPPPQTSGADPSNGVSVIPYENNSGTGGAVPQALAKLKWNWGAAGLNMIWMANHGLRREAGFVAVFLMLERWLEHAVLPPDFRIGLGFWVVFFALGLNGHRLAWKKRHYANLIHYFEIETAWRNWGIFALIVTAAVFGYELYLLHTLEQEMLNAIR